VDVARHAHGRVARARTNAAVVNDGVVIYEARDGRLVRSWTLNDRLGLLQALGAVPTRVTR
jgi:ketosteroid isomerase-like protein